MAIYSMSMSNVSRAAGSSSCATLSYITAEHVRDERLGETYYGFSRRERVEQTGFLQPEGSRFASAAEAFNNLECHEKAANARTAKKIMVALPREFDADTGSRVVEEYITANLTSLGYVAAYAIHRDKDGNNPHAHILVANRQLDGSGEWVKTKRKMAYQLDDAGNRIPRIDPDTGLQKVDGRNRRQWVRVSVQTNPLDLKDTLQGLREQWSVTCNRLLPEELHIDHRSNKERGIEANPTIHEGYAAHEIERRGGTSDRCQTNRVIRSDNRLLDKLAQQLDSLKESISQLVEQIRQSKLVRHLTGNGKPEPAPAHSAQELARDWLRQAESRESKERSDSKLKAADRVADCKKAVEASETAAKAKPEALKLIEACDGYDRINAKISQAGPIKRLGLKRELSRWAESHGLTHVLGQPDTWSDAGAWKERRLPEIIKNDPDVMKAKTALYRAKDWERQTRWAATDPDRVQRIAHDLGVKSKDPLAAEARHLIDRRSDPSQRRRRGLSR